MKDNSKLREKEYFKLGSTLITHMYRKDIEQSYLAFLEDHNLSRDESSIIREYLKQIILSHTSLRSTYNPDTFNESYYHLAFTFHTKMAHIFKNKTNSIEDFHKKNKLRLNEQILVSFMATAAFDMPLMMAQIKREFDE